MELHTAGGKDQAAYCALVRKEWGEEGEGEVQSAGAYFSITRNKVKDEVVCQLFICLV